MVLRAWESRSALIRISQGSPKCGMANTGLAAVDAPSSHTLTSTDGGILISQKAYKRSMRVPESPSPKVIEETERSNVGTGRLKQKDRPMLCRTFARSDPRSEYASSILQGCILHEFRFTPRDIACCLGNTTLFCRFIIKPSLFHALCEGMGC